MTNFNWRTKLKQIKNCIRKNMGIKNKLKIKRIRDKMKNNIYNQFQLKGTIKKIKTSFKKNQEKKIKAKGLKQNTHKQRELTSILLQ